MSKPVMGVFYVIQPIPLLPEHIKVGFTSDLQRRMKAYLALCPQAQVIKTWACAGTQTEQEAIRFIAAIGFEQIGPEVFKCYVLPDLLRYLDAFFAYSAGVTPAAIERRPMQHVSKLAKLLELLQSGKYSGTQLAHELDMDQRSIRRQIERLQWLGIPVKGIRGRYGYMWVPPEFDTKQLSLFDLEAAMPAVENLLKNLK